MVRGSVAPMALMALVGGVAVGCDDDTPITDAGTADVGLLCAAPEEECGGVCVDTTVSTAHCGQCDVPCAPGDECIAGGCRAPCTAMAPDRCGLECVDTTTSSDHCGECDRPCGPGYACTIGRCLRDCGGSLDGTVVEIVAVFLEPRLGPVGTVFQINYRYTVHEAVEDMVITVTVSDLDDNVYGTIVDELTGGVPVGTVDVASNFDSSVLPDTGFYAVTLILCTPQGGDISVGSVFRAT